MKIIINLLLIMLCVPVGVKSQCTEAKDPDMAKYKRLTETQDAQGCSQCAMLSLYFCSAKYCVKPEDIRKVDAMITACKSNIKTMGQPYCCPELVNKQPQWGVGVSGSTSGAGSSGSSTTTGSGPSTSNGTATTNSSNYNQTYSGAGDNTNDNDLDEVLNTTASVLDLLSGGNGTTDIASGDESDIINATAEVIQGIVNSGNAGMGVGLNTNGSYTTGSTYNNTADATNYLNQVVNELGSGTYSSTDISAGMDIVNGVGAILNVIEEADAEAERNRQAELQRQRQLEEIRQREERARQERLRIINNRKVVVNSLPQAKMPLVHPGISNNEIYFFAYFTTNASLESNNPEISISNVFTISKYSDGSWPLLSRLIEKLTYQTKTTGIQLAGYYTTLFEAETDKRNLIAQAQAVSIKILGIQYSEKNQTTNANTSGTDFWETNYKKQSDAGSNTNTSNKDNSTKPALDFWDNPIKQ